MNTHFASKDLTVGQLNAMVKQLGGPDIVRQYLRGNGLVVKQAPPQFEILRSIEVGTFKSGPNMSCNLHDLPFQFTKEAFAKLESLSIGNANSLEKDRRTIDLVGIRTSELFGHNAGEVSWHRFLTTVEDAGYKLCPPETAVQMMIQCPDVFDTTGWVTIPSKTCRRHHIHGNGYDEYTGITFCPDAGEVDHRLGNNDPIFSEASNNDATSWAGSSDSELYIFMTA